MSQSSNPRTQKSSSVKEKQVLESESNCVESLVKSSQLECQIGITNVSLKKRETLKGPEKKGRRRRSRILKMTKLKVPRVLEKLVSIVNILRHENFLKVVNRFFKPMVNNYDRGVRKSRRRLKSQKFQQPENVCLQRTVSTLVDFDSDIV